jgi:voltage-gated potassium channel
MKFAASMIAMLAAPLSGGKARSIVRLGLVFLLAVAAFAAGFQLIMSGVEGRSFTWWSAIYWTLVTMTTLGFGDIVFESDLGRMYSVLVLMFGALLILILLPFTFIQLVYLPWRSAVREARTPRSLPEDIRGHLLITGRAPLELSLMRRAATAGVPYVLLVEDIEEAASLHDAGYPVMVGDLDDPATYRAARVDQAAMVVTARSDQANSNVAFTVREVTDEGIVVATANSADAVDVLHLAGADCVLQLGELLGEMFAQRILEPTARSSVISTFENLVIAETSAAGTELVGRTLAELDLRQRFGISVVGLWDRGELHPATPHLKILETSILLLTGTRAQLHAYDEAYADGHPGGDPADGDDTADGDHGENGMAGTNGAQGPVVILGGGRVGRAVARNLREAGQPSRIVEKQEARVRHLDPDDVVVGDAADLEVLRRAGIEAAPAVVVTTHDDDTNIFLTLYSRKLRAGAEILGRVEHERNITTMHRAGADFVLSYASMGAIEAWNALRDDSTLLLAEGLVVFRVPMPQRLAGRPLRSTAIPTTTGCTVVGIVRDGECATDVHLDDPLPADAELLLIGDEEAEERFYRRYVSTPPPRGLRGWWRRLASSE